MLYTLSPVANIKELSILLLEDLRIDEAELLKLDIKKITMLAEHYHSTNVKKLSSLLRRIKG